MTADNRLAFTIRVKPADKAAIVDASKAMGVEAGIVGRMIMEAVAARLRNGDDLFDVIAVVRTKPVVRVPARSAP